MTMGYDSSDPSAHLAHSAPLSNQPGYGLGQPAQALGAHAGGPLAWDRHAPRTTGGSMSYGGSERGTRPTERGRDMVHSQYHTDYSSHDGSRHHDIVQSLNAPPQPEQASSFSGSFHQSGGLHGGYGSEKRMDFAQSPAMHNDHFNHPPSPLEPDHRPLPSMGYPPNGTAYDQPPVHHLAQESHALQNSHGGPSPALRMCIGCQRPASVHCKSCNADYCVACDKTVGVAGPAHVKLHISGPLNQKRQPQAIVCTEHNKPLELFCNDCVSPACSQCVVFGAHKNHECITIDLAFKLAMDTVRTKLQILDHTSESHAKVLEQLKGQRLRLSSRVDNAIGMISREFSLLQKKSVERKEKLMGEIELLKDETLVHLNELAETLDRDLEELVKVHKSVQLICDDSTQLQFIKANRAMSKDLDVMIEKDRRRDRKIGQQPNIHMNVNIDDIMSAIMDLSQKNDSRGKGLTGTLVYEDDADSNGLFFRLGTQNRSKFQSPVKTGLVTVTASKWHISSDVFASQSLWQPNEGFLLTGNAKGSWIQFQINKGFVITPTHYRIQNGNRVRPGARMNYVLRNWIFEGSVDGTTWELLRDHVDDVSLAEEQHAMASWDIKSEKQFNVFRIRNTGQDSGKQFFTHLGSIEIWGVVAHR